MLPSYIKNELELELLCKIFHVEGVSFEIFVVKLVSNGTVFVLWDETYCTEKEKTELFCSNTRL